MFSRRSRTALHTQTEFAIQLFVCHHPNSNLKAKSWYLCIPVGKFSRLLNSGIKWIILSCRHNMSTMCQGFRILCNGYHNPRILRIQYNLGCFSSSFAGQFCPISKVLTYADRSFGEDSNGIPASCLTYSMVRSLSVLISSILVRWRSISALWRERYTPLKKR